MTTEITIPTREYKDLLETGVRADILEDFLRQEKSSLTDVREVAKIMGFDIPERRKADE